MPSSGNFRLEPKVSNPSFEPGKAKYVMPRKKKLLPSSVEQRVAVQRGDLPEAAFKFLTSEPIILANWYLENTQGPTVDISIKLNPDGTAVWSVARSQLKLMGNGDD